MLRHPEDRLPLLLILCLFAVDLAVWWLVSSPWLVAAWTLASLLPKAGVCAFNHHQSRWAREDGTRMGEWEYTWITILTAYPRAWAVGARYPKIRRLFLLMGLATAALVALRPVAGVLLFVLTPALLLAGTALATRAHHSDRSTEDHMAASNNILQPFYNWLTCNLGYHTAHHYETVQPVLETVQQ